MTDRRTALSLWRGQLFHLGCLAVLLSAAFGLWDRLGRPFPVAFWFATAVPVTHQVFVWLSWRLELRSAAVTRTIGFGGFVAVFYVLIASRFVSLLVLAWLDRGTLGVPSSPRWIAFAALASTGLFAAYSVGRYFGITRAAGADHFERRYRSMPLVRQGVYRLTRNGMYAFLFLLFWAIAIGFDSSAATVVAAFSHAYVWVHFFGTEKPDMEYLYSSAD